jgi:hypothetical protein
VSRTAKSLLTLVTAVALAGTAAPAFADDPPAEPPPACYDVDGTPIFDPVVCEEKGRQASGH